MPKFNGVNHLAFATGDMNKTIRYWRDLLGMRLVAGLGRPGFRHYFFELSENDLVAFFEWEGVEPVKEKDHGRPVSGPFVFDHVSFGVDSENELWEIKDRIAAAGFHVSEVVDHGFIHSIYTFDPNGIPLEFSYNVPDIDVRAQPFMKDKEPVENADEGSEPVSGKWPAVSQPTLESDRRVYPGVGSELYHFLKHRKEG
jgi:catechol 2,3-dioxygenase-like lactoylglutathione lyase family enzyme